MIKIWEIFIGILLLILRILKIHYSLTHTAIQVINLHIYETGLL